MARWGCTAPPPEVLSRGWVRGVLLVFVAGEWAPAGSDSQGWCCIPCMEPALARREWLVAGDDEEQQQQQEEVLVCTAVVVPLPLVGIVVVVAVGVVVLSGRGMLLV